MLPLPLLLLLALGSDTAPQPALAGLTNPARLSGGFHWCECGTGSSSLQIWPTGDVYKTHRIKVGAPLPNWLDFGVPVKSVSTYIRSLTTARFPGASLTDCFCFPAWLCDGMTKEMQVTLPEPSRWWTASLPVPLANGLPTHPTLCPQQRHTGRAHIGEYTRTPHQSVVSRDISDRQRAYVQPTGKSRSPSAVWSSPRARAYPPSPRPVRTTTTKQLTQLDTQGCLDRLLVVVDACIKIPVLLATHAGTLLALAEARVSSCSDGAQTDLIVKRSTDQGTSW